MTASAAHDDSLINVAGRTTADVADGVLCNQDVTVIATAELGRCDHHRILV
ncbi:MAG TPA: hypothetical protein VHV78_08975 [Gemmatimonadaceae bacterium]|nr:hypothetical protein [Gemmatimonadaceae bacterium]